MAQTATHTEGGVIVELAHDEQTVLTYRRRIIANASSDLLYAPARGSTARHAVSELVRIAGSGVAVRVLCGSAELAAVATDGGAKARICDAALPELLIADERTALLRLAGARALLINAPVLVTTLVALGEQAWEAAGPPAEQAGMTPVILRAMMAGHKDAVAARQLGLSIRQYRRYVAEIMRDIGAASRFQAGARAVELGLLTGAAQPMMPPSTGNTPPVR